MAKSSANRKQRQSAAPNKTAEALRSRTMRAVKSKDTGPEMIVRRFLHAAGLRYRLHDTRLPGKPDLVFPGRRIALFVHGCFWHQHPNCPASARPKSSLDYWTRKLDGNVARDARHQDALKAAGWTVLVIWECQTRNVEALDELLRELELHRTPRP
ncbi:very short patch repair endonuclease [Burkholderia multivorans]|uniref:very short patch repair endonuclease n=2 Tax=Burkholderia multivorans TaxID=87883 RepID=UPI000D001529|nr:very short patch repair endonuclease [Burkholderia multivorans]MBU9246578.1 very short patch repair endonuclease [Burkholderia multivorans]MBU9413707.1 very short patch repair endonuclease [Burkholderia multivorans]PRE19435.1 very short patch repair endonuclease [Burkholderia multivorans]PRF87233.1 very short patch repair endonuclease [Burkholderia multivorans]QET30488.1 very short patch repair endonuclease [Burkholderia multivorans]